MDDTKHLCDLDAERAVLGSMMADRNVIDDVLAIIPDGTAFGLDVHRIICRALRVSFESGDPMDLLVFENVLRSEGDLERVGGREYLIELHESFGDPANAGYYARIVADFYYRRRVYVAAESLMHAALDTVGTPNDALARKLAMAADSESVACEFVEPKPMAELLPAIGAEWRKSRAMLIRCGLSVVDAKLGGMSRPSYLVIAACPSMGKTTLGMNWLVSAAQQGLPGIFISLEQGWKEVAGRSIAHLTGQSLHRLKRESSPDEQDAACTAAYVKLQGAAPMFVLDNVNTLTEARRIINWGVRKHGVKIVVLDYLQLLGSDERSENRNLEIAKMSRTLRRIANQHDLLLIVASQLNRQAAEAGVKPRLKHLRDSGAIEQDADVVMFLHPVSAADWRQSKEPIVDLIVAKNREGPTGSVALRFDKPTFTFKSGSDTDQTGTEDADFF